jgi:hypothetical protein
VSYSKGLALKWTETLFLPLINSAGSKHEWQRFPNGRYDGLVWEPHDVATTFAAALKSAKLESVDGCLQVLHIDAPYPFKARESQTIVVRRSGRSIVDKVLAHLDDEARRQDPDLDTLLSSEVKVGPGAALLTPSFPLLSSEVELRDGTNMRTAELVSTGFASSTR